MLEREPLTNLVKKKKLLRFDIKNFGNVWILLG